ncbi:dihydrofolate reductase family protein [Methylonatrum kenyense]|uniref:dihydrofolate reductase family protein n=1 Tax=Methylonatrum kenyense TaxID=455253 RepID=UPI0020BF78D9|nr:dihydrofolate reductase family protein [Methylonatrum kenyense]MCK8515064.1 dihydrofolate reductase family protein [Methylonatrum kenyense]
MRKLIASTFVSLDGVMQAPGGPEEDRSGSFSRGGWTFGFWDEVMGLAAAGFDGTNRELLLGRRTYEIFAAHWPYQPPDDPTAQTLNAARKYVASRTLETLDWHNAELLGNDVPKAVAALKAEPGHDLQLIGSGHLIQSLQAEALIDEYNVWTFPVILGRGKRLFEATATPCALRLVQTQTSTTGVVMSTYAPNGPLRPGSLASTEPSARELERRARMTAEER